MYLFQKCSWQGVWNALLHCLDQKQSLAEPKLLDEWFITKFEFETTGACVPMHASQVMLFTGLSFKLQHGSMGARGTLNNSLDASSLLIIFSPSALTKMMPSTEAIDQCCSNTHAQLPPSYYVNPLKMVSNYFFEHLPGYEVYVHNPGKVIAVLFSKGLGCIFNIL